MNTSSLITVGVMSGTSLDGVDAVAVRFCGDRMTELGHVYVPFDEPLRAALLALCSPGDNEIERAGIAGTALSDIYAEAVTALLEKTGLDRRAVAAVGVHGQTVRHCPDIGFTVQIHQPARLAEKLGIDVIADFRARDVAAGGEGAPLVPAFHARAFAGPAARAVVNIGGMANVSLLPPAGQDGPVLGSDTGPGNVLLDTWCARHLGKPYDEGGRWAAAGRVNPALLDAWLSHPFFKRPFPKSTGRELFNASFIDSAGAALAACSAQDVARTLTALTARGIALAVKEAPQTRELFVCGGGAYNATLLDELARATGRPVYTTAALGIDPMQVEAAAFAWLAMRFIARLPGNLPAVTHAAGPRILGALYPH